MRALVCEQFGPPSEVAHVKAWPEPDTPKDHEVTVSAVVKQVDDTRKLLTADGFLIVDGRIIYQMTDFTLRMSEI